jgi:hypothetical protein
MAKIVIYGLGTNGRNSRNSSGRFYYEANASTTFHFSTFAFTISACVTELTSTEGKFTRSNLAQMRTTIQARET